MLIFISNNSTASVTTKGKKRGEIEGRRKRKRKRERLDFVQSLLVESLVRLLNRLLRQMRGQSGSRVKGHSRTNEIVGRGLLKIPTSTRSPSDAGKSSQQPMRYLVSSSIKPALIDALKLRNACHRVLHLLIETEPKL